MEEEHGLSPLAAYEAVMHFATERGEAALRLALHAAVLQMFHPELLHLLKRNFVPEAADDPAVEADVLFSPLCEEMGRGYFRFDPQVRALLLENLTANYPSKTSSRIGKVADFIISYVDHQERNPNSSQDQLSRDYLELQRWVAFAYAEPAAAARQFAAALHSAQQQNDVAARIQLGGLAGALNAPLAGFSQLLNYAEGLQELEAGNRERADELFETIDDGELTIGETTLRATSQILADWQARHPEYEPGPDEQVVQKGAEEKPETIDEVDEAIRELESGTSGSRHAAVSRLDRPDAPDKAVQALIDHLEDSDLILRMACVNALAHIATEAAINGLGTAVGNGDTDTAETAIEWLSRFDKKVVLILSAGPKVGTEPHVIEEALKYRGYLSSFVSRISVRLASYAKFLLVNVSNFSVMEQLREIIPQLSIPVQPIARHGTDAGMLAELQPTFSPMPFRMYNDAADLDTILHEIIDRIEIRISEPTASPQFEYDIFISYVRADQPTATEDDERLAVALGSELSRRLVATGRAPKIFFDRDIYRREGAIDTSAVFLVILSPAYVRSPACEQELAAIISWSTEKSYAVRRRIFKVIKDPVSPGSEPKALHDLDAYDFREERFGKWYDRPTKSGTPWAADMPSASSELDRLTSDIAVALEQIHSSVPSTSRPFNTEPTASQTNKLDVLIVYEHSDRRQAQMLQNHFTLQLRGNRTRLSEMEILRDVDADHQRIRDCDAVLFLVSAHLIESKLMRSGFIETIIKTGRLVIPIIIRPCVWRQTSFRSLHVLPVGGQPITNLKDKDRVYFDITREIDRAIERLREERKQIGDVPRDSTSKAPISRWPVITGTDVQFKAVNPRPVSTTIEKLNALRRPNDMPLTGGNPAPYNSRRATPAETTTWTVEAFITGFKLNSSGSFRLTFQGAKGATMIAQVPDPQLVDSASPWIKSFMKVRQTLSERFKFEAGYSRLEPPMRALVTGVGLFRQAHGQIGVAANAIEIYPILDFKWLPLGREIPRPVAKVGWQPKPKVRSASSRPTKLRKSESKKKAAKRLRKQAAKPAAKALAKASGKKTAASKKRVAKLTRPSPVKSTKSSVKKSVKSLRKSSRRVPGKKVVRRFSKRAAKVKPKKLMKR